MGLKRSPVGAVRTRCAPQALDYAEQLFESGDRNKDGKLSLEELRELLTTASKEFSHLEEHARFLDRCGQGQEQGQGLG